MKNAIIGVMGLLLLVSGASSCMVVKKNGYYQSRYYSGKHRTSHHNQAKKTTHIQADVRVLSDPLGEDGLSPPLKARQVGEMAEQQQPAPNGLACYPYIERSTGLDEHPYLPTVDISEHRQQVGQHQTKELQLQMKEQQSRNPLIIWGVAIGALGLIMILISVYTDGGGFFGMAIALIGGILLFIGVIEETDL